MRKQQKLNILAGVMTALATTEAELREVLPMLHDLELRHPHAASYKRELNKFATTISRLQHHAVEFDALRRIIREKYPEGERPS